MPIQFSDKIQTLDQEAFHKLDRSVMRAVFDTQNTLGCILDEKIYRNELTYRLEAQKLNCESESEVMVAHRDFYKRYYVDLIIEGVVYELKAVTSLTKSHEAQTLNYLLLTNTQHGKLINFRPCSVHSKFVSTKLTTAKRSRFDLYYQNSNLKPEYHPQISDLFEDLGTHLEINLYRQALYHLLDCKIEAVKLQSHSGHVGNQSLALLNQESALIVTGLKTSPRITAYRTQLLRMLKLTNLESFQWLNASNHSLTLSTLARK